MLINPAYIPQEDRLIVCLTYTGKPSNILILFPLIYTSPDIGIFMPFPKITSGPGILFILRSIRVARAREPKRTSFMLWEALTPSVLTRGRSTVHFQIRMENCLQIRSTADGARRLST